MIRDLLDRFVADLKLRGYAERSARTYMRSVRQLQNFCCCRLEEVIEEQLREYWLYCKNELKWSASTLRISYSGIKLFFTHTLKRDWEVLRAVKFERDQTLPHVHFVIPGGGLSQDRDKWVASSGHFLVHVRALSRMFRGKMKAALREAGLMEKVPPEVWTQEWVVHCKPVGDGRHIMKYLGAYVFRVAISNARVVAYDGRNVTFKYQKVRSSKWKKMTLPAIEFMRRYLQHVLPGGFMKVRHYGFLSPNFGVPIQKIRELICVLYELLRNAPVRIRPPNQPRPLKCSRCSAVMKWVRYLPPVSASP